MSEKNSFKSTVESLFSGMDAFLSSKTVVGDAIHIGDTIILPLVDVSFGIGAGSFAKEKNESGAGGMGARLEPSAVLVVQNNTTRLVNIKNQDSITKLLDMLPDLADKITAAVAAKKGDSRDETEEAAREAAAEELSDLIDRSVNPD